MSIKQNLFSNIPESFPEEIFETLLENNRFKLERIISSGQSMPAGKWFDQETDEWVVLLKGKAGLRFENESKVIAESFGHEAMNNKWLNDTWWPSKPGFCHSYLVYS